MGMQKRIEPDQAMASRWRRRRMCILLAETPVPAALREISARGAFLETNARPPLGTAVELRHPEAGSIQAIVQALTPDGVRIAFPCSESSMAFAVAAIAADMSRPD
ncbi:MAG TPA: hypothetical protein VEZ70_06720 [Allosphingosinicella sp.]|jgi:hypothetical protein|nr:hypothetical protein [Allosphingosinicella sp.]